MYKLLLSLCFLTLLSPMALAEPTERPRISIEAGAAISDFFPNFHGRVSYRLPMFEDRLDLLIDYSPIVKTAQPMYTSQVLMAGTRYYFLTEDLWQPYAVLTAGAMYHLAGNNTPTGTGYEGGLDLFMLQVGVGIDLMIHRHIGLNAQLTSGLGGLARPELNAKIAF